MSFLSDGTDWLPFRHDDIDWRLHLLPVPIDDHVFLGELWRLRNLEAETAVSTMARPKGQTRSQIQDMLRSRQSSSDFHYAIALVHTSLAADMGTGNTDFDVRYAGLISGIWSDDVSRVIEVGITMFAAWRGNGIAARALDLFSTRLWNLFRVRKVVARVLSGNEPSKRLFESSGYRTAGELRQHYFVGGRFHDVTIFEKLLAAEES